MQIKVRQFYKYNDKIILPLRVPIGTLREQEDIDEDYKINQPN